MCSQLANRFGATFGPVFSLKSSSDRTLRSLFRMGQGKLGRGTRKQKNATTHTPAHAQPNKQVGMDFCTYLVHVREKNALFIIFVYLIFSLSKTKLFLSIGRFRWFFHSVSCCLMLFFSRYLSPFLLSADKVYALRPHGGCIIPVKEAGQLILYFCTYNKLRYTT